MITGASSVKKEIVPHGENYYLISATIVHQGEGDTFYITVLKDSYIRLESLPCPGLNEMLVLFDSTVEKYKAIAGA